MKDGAPLDAMTALEEARAQLETALQSDAHWRALGQATLPANRAAHERALADKPVYHAWKLLGRAIEELRAAETMHGPAGQDGRAAPRPRVELRQVLERIRSETPFDSAEPGAAAAEDEAPIELPDTPAIAPPDIVIEEAAVSFLLLEPGTPAPEPAPAAEQAVEPQAAQGGADRPGTGADGGDDDADATETEVTIVSRRS